MICGLCSDLSEDRLIRESKKFDNILSLTGFVLAVFVIYLIIIIIIINKIYREYFFFN